MLVLQPGQKQRISNLQLDTGNELISPSPCEKLLGAYVSQDLKWDQHIKLHSGSAVNVLTSRLYALCKISQFASFKTRKMVANGIFNSSLIYMIQLWGGSSHSLINCLQIIQNKAARYVTKKGIRTPVKILLKECGWLSVKQLVVFHNCLSVYKIKHHLKPAYFSEKFGGIFVHEDTEPISSRTRLQSTGGIRPLNLRNKSNLDRQSFAFNSVDSWNSLPFQIRQSKSLSTFKKSLRAWCLQNVPMR